MHPFATSSAWSAASGSPPRFSYPSADFATSQELRIGSSFGASRRGARPSTAVVQASASQMRPSTALGSQRPATAGNVLLSSAASFSSRIMSAPPTPRQSNRSGLDGVVDHLDGLASFEVKLGALTKAQEQQRQLIRSLTKQRQQLWEQQQSEPPPGGWQPAKPIPRPQVHRLDKAAGMIRNRLTSHVARVPPYATNHAQPMNHAMPVPAPALPVPAPAEAAAADSRRSSVIFKPTRHGLRSWTPLVEDPYCFQRLPSGPSTPAPPETPLGLCRTGPRHEKERFLREEWGPFLEELEDALVCTKTRHVLGVAIDDTLPSQAEWDRWSARCAQLTAVWHGAPNVSAVYELLIACTES